MIAMTFHQHSLRWEISLEISDLKQDMPRIPVPPTCSPFPDTPESKRMRIKFILKLKISKMYNKIYPYKYTHKSLAKIKGSNSR